MPQPPRFPLKDAAATLDEFANLGVLADCNNLKRCIQAYKLLIATTLQHNIDFACLEPTVAVPGLQTSGWFRTQTKSNVRFYIKECQGCLLRLNATCIEYILEASSEIQERSLRKKKIYSHYMDGPNIIIGFNARQRSDERSTSSPYRLPGIAAVMFTNADGTQQNLGKPYSRPLLTYHSNLANARSESTLPPTSLKSSPSICMAAVLPLPPSRRS